MSPFCSRSQSPSSCSVLGSSDTAPRLMMSSIKGPRLANAWVRTSGAQEAVHASRYRSRKPDLTVEPPTWLHASGIVSSILIAVLTSLLSIFKKYARRLSTFRDAAAS